MNPRFVILATSIFLTTLSTPSEARRHRSLDGGLAIAVCDDSGRPCSQIATWPQTAREGRRLRRSVRTAHRADRHKQAHSRQRPQERQAIKPKPEPVIAKAQDRAPTDAVKEEVASEKKPDRNVLASLGNIAGLKSYFVAKLAALRSAMPAGLSFKVGSGFRSHSEQARLHAQKPGLAARPGYSNHERGLAGDLSFSRGAARWVHANARKHGLRFPMSYEPWHIEPEGVTRYARHHHRTRYASAGR